MSWWAWVLVAGGATAVIIGWFGLLVWWLDECPTAAFLLVVGTVMASVAVVGLWPDDGDRHTVDWKGGDGPDTACWYQLMDDPDTTVMAGKTPVVVDGGNSWHTVCSKDGQDIPKEGSR